MYNKFEVMKMIFSEKLQLLRKSKGFTQEELAERLDVSRQAVAKWESGQVYPDISNLIQISDLFNVSIDYLVRDQDCMLNISVDIKTDLDKLIDFRLEANRNTYAAAMNETNSTRLDSHDFRYTKGSLHIMTHMWAENNLQERKPFGRMEKPFMR